MENNKKEKNQKQNQRKKKKEASKGYTPRRVKKNKTGNVPRNRAAIEAKKMEEKRCETNPEP